jgi:hypothetical protein
MAEEKKLSGPDFAQGVSLTEFTDGGRLQGHLKASRSWWLGAAILTSL